jgi:hypothetical protein
MDLRLNLSVNLSFDLNFCLPVVKDGVSVPEGNLMERYSAILIYWYQIAKSKRQYERIDMQKSLYFFKIFSFKLKPEPYLD